MSYVDRATDRAPAVQRTRSRTAAHASAIVEVAERLLSEKGNRFTIQDVAREARVALQTFYVYFGSKDQLLLAVIEDMVLREAARYEQASRDVEDPLERLFLCITAGMDADLRGPVSGHRFITGEFWRLYQLFPEETARAIQPFVDLTRRRLAEAREAGVIATDHIEADARLIVQLVLAAYHERAFAPRPSTAEAMQLWRFCLSAVGGRGDLATPAASLS